MEQRTYKSIRPKVFPRKKIPSLLEEEVFSNVHFINHVKEVSFKTNINEKIVAEVLKSYFTNIFKVMNSIRKFKTKINVYGFFSLIVMKGRNVKIKKDEYT